MLSLIALSSVLLLDSIALLLGSIDSSSSIIAIGRIDGSLASSFELFESFLEEGAGVSAGAATFHVGGDVGPEAGGVGVFDFFLGEEEVLVLLVGTGGLVS